MIFIRNDHSSHNPREAMDIDGLRRSVRAAARHARRAGRMSGPPRDLVGYGGRRRRAWPNGAKLAVSVAVNFEEGAESSIEAGDAAGEADRRGDDGHPAGIARHRPGAAFRVRHARGAVAHPGALDATASKRRSGCAATRWSACPRSPGRSSRRDTKRRATAGAGVRIPISPMPRGERADARTLHRRRCSPRPGTRPVGFFCRGSQSATRALLTDLGFNTTATRWTTICRIG